MGMRFAVRWLLVGSSQLVGTPGSGTESGQ